jgi:hypothetical protein
VTENTRDHAKTVLGAEHDSELWNAVLEILRELGATKVEETWGLAGSQELQRLEVMLGNEMVVVEGETYIGLSITATPEIVNRVSTRLRDRLPQGSLPR